LSTSGTINRGTCPQQQFEHRYVASCSGNPRGTDTGLPCDSGKNAVNVIAIGQPLADLCSIAARDSSQQWLPVLPGPQASPNHRKRRLQGGHLRARRGLSQGRIRA